MVVLLDAALSEELGAGVSLDGTVVLVTNVDGGVLDGVSGGVVELNGSEVLAVDKTLLKQSVDPAAKHSS